MAVLIRGITVTLYERVQTGADAFGAPVYTERPVAVENVLVTPTASTEVLDAVQLHGKRAEYELCLPKNDTREWENRRVDFFGQRWQTVGVAVQYIKTPLDWNRKIKVARYG